MTDEAGAGTYGLVSTGDVRRDAYEVWVLLADRSAKRTAAILQEELGVTVSPDVIRQWAHRQGWAASAPELLGQAGPSYLERTKAALVAAGPPAADYLRRVVEGRQPADRGAVVAAVAALDRLGFLPFTRREAEAGHSPIARPASSHHTAYDSLSDTELAAIVAGRLRAAADPVTDTE